MTLYGWSCFESFRFFCDNRFQEKTFLCDIGPVWCSGPAAPERIWKYRGHMSLLEAPDFFCRALHFFGSTSTIGRFGERCRDGPACCSTHGAPPPCSAICKSGGHVSPVPCGVGATVSGCRINSPGFLTEYIVRAIGEKIGVACLLDVCVYCVVLSCVFFLCSFCLIL